MAFAGGCLQNRVCRFGDIRDPILRIVHFLKKKFINGQEIRKVLLAGVAGLPGQTFLIHWFCMYFSYQLMSVCRFNGIIRHQTGAVSGNVKRELDAFRMLSGCIPDAISFC